MRLPKLKPTPTTVLNGAGIVIAVYLFVVLGQTINHNYQLSRQVNQLNAQVDLLQAQKTQLADSLQYYNSPAFRDREARSKLGLQLPGENVIIIPHENASPAVTPTPQPVARRSNLQQWIDFLAGRRSS